MACDIQIPESLTITGSPNVHLPLGSPFKSLPPEERLEYYVSLAGIRDMMSKNAESSNIKVYNYQVPGEYDTYQTYVVHYPLIEMQLDLTEYVDKAVTDALNIDGEQIQVNVPEIEPHFPEIETYPYYLIPIMPGCVKPETPLYNIELDEMYKLVKRVDGGPFGIEIKYNEGFEENLRVKMPGFGINDYIKGKKETVNGVEKLRFLSDDDTFYPGNLENGTLKAYFKVIGPCTGLELPDLVFEWETAIIETKNSDYFKGDYTIKNDLNKFLGTGVSLSDAQGYMYIDGIEEAALDLTYEYSGITPVDLYPDRELVKQTRPSFSETITTTLPKHNHIDVDKLIKMLNHPDEIVLKYKINIEEMEIENKEESISGRTVSADLVILLPLVFKAEAPSDFSEYGDYAKISLNNLLPKPAEGEEKKDLFMRNEDGNGWLSNISQIKISLKNYKNDILDADELGILLTAERPDRRQRTLFDY